MTQTTNIGLKKIDGSENWRQIFDYYNDSADKTDSAVAAVQDGLAIVADGNTHAAVAKGRFVYVRNHDTLADGLYKATAEIATNGTLSTSNLTAESSGGLNDLQERVTSLQSIESKPITAGSGVTIAVQNCILFPNMALFLINAMLNVTSPVSAGGTVFSLPSGLVAAGRTDLQVNGTLLMVANRTAKISVVTGTLAAGTYDITLAMIVTNA